MKTLLKTIGIAAGVVAAASAAHANLNETLYNSVSGELNVNSSATLSAGLWTYSYTITDVTPNTDGISGYTVNVPDAPALDIAVTPGPTGTSLSTGLPLAFFGQVLPNSGGEVTWSTGGPDDSLSTGLTFSFTSPFAPVQGTSGALDSGGYTADGGSVYIPSIPDGGMTMSLLGGSLLGLGALRRKLVR